MKAFLGITAHWISDWNIHECVLDFVDISDFPHTGENLAKVVKKIIEEAGLQNNIIAIVADNARNNDTMILNIQPMNIEQVRCFGHVLNIVVQDALGHISDSIICLRELVKKIRYSPQRLEKLAKLCSSADIPQVKPLLDVSTRWSSTFTMIMRAIEIRKVIGFYSYIF